MPPDDTLQRLRRMEQDVARLAAEVARLCALAEGDNRNVGRTLDALSKAIEQVHDSLQALIEKWDRGMQRMEDRTGRLEKEVVRLQGNVEGLTRRQDEADLDRTSIKTAVRDGFDQLHERINKTREMAKEDADGAADRTEGWLKAWLPYIILGVVVAGLGVLRLATAN